jgi:peptidyl-tRNA hydrolase, PTH1 family
VKLVIGLGNPGKKYELTRHNVGFLVVERVAARQRIAVRKRCCESLAGEWVEGGEKIVLAKPQTYMNRCGAAVKDLLGEFRGLPSELVVIYDDLDLPFGRIRVRPKGSAGGHRGLASIMESLAGADFPRVRVGIGRPPEGVEAVEYVLQPFDEIQSGALHELIGKTTDAVLVLLRRGIEVAMREFNRAD